MEKTRMWSQTDAVDLLNDNLFNVSMCALFNVPMCAFFNVPMCALFNVPMCALFGNFFKW